MRMHSYLLVLMRIYACLSLRGCSRAFSFSTSCFAGYVTAADVARAAKAVGSSLSSEDVDLMVREADRTGDGRLSFGDFERVFRRMRGVPGRPEGEALEVVVDDDDEDDL